MNLSDKICALSQKQTIYPTSQKSLWLSLCQQIFHYSTWTIFYIRMKSPKSHKVRETKMGGLIYSCIFSTNQELAAGYKRWESLKIWICVIGYNQFHWDSLNVPCHGSFVHDSLSTTKWKEHLINHLRLSKSSTVCYEANICIITIWIMRF